MKAIGLTEFGGPDVLHVVDLPTPMGPRGGAYAEHIVVDERSVVHAPRDTTHSEVSTLLLNALTAHLALDALHLDAGQSLAVTGAAGVLGGYAIHLARARGLTMIADAAEPWTAATL